MSPNADISNLISEMQQAVRHVGHAGGYLVVVCPSRDASSECSKILGTIIPANAKFAGRTAELSNMGRLSVADVAEDIFVPDDTPFGVTFVGWTGKDNPKEMAKWQSKATQVVRL